MAKDSGRKVIASNRKARHDYLIEDTLEAGLALMGTEVKSCPWHQTAAGWTAASLPVCG